MSGLIYIAGAYSAPTPEGVRANVRQAIGVYMRFCDAGLTPVLPHFSHFAHLLHPRGYEFWMDLDFRLIEGCGALYRMPNKSSGGDREVVKANEIGIPVFRDEAEAIAWGQP